MLIINTSLGQVNLVQRHHLRAVEKLVPDEQHNEQNDTDVACEEVAGAPVNEGSETVRHKDQNTENQTVPREVGLEGCRVRQVLARDVLRLECLHEADVAKVDERPADETCDSDDVEEPIEDDCAALREVEEPEETECGGEGDGKVRSTKAVRSGEDARSVSFLGQSDDDAAGGVDVRVGGGQDGGEEDGIDDVGEDGDTSETSDNDERRGRGVGAVVLKPVVGVWDVEADEEDGSHEECEDAAESPLDGRRDGLPRVGSLTSSNTNELNTLVTETSGDQHSPESDKFASRATLVDHVRGESARVAPVLEPDVSLVTDTGVDADGEYDESDDSDDLDAGKPHLDFTEPSHGEVVGGSEDNPEDGDPDTNADVFGSTGPVLNDESSSSELKRICQTPAEEVDPAHSEADSRINKS